MFEGDEIKGRKRQVGGSWTGWVPRYSRRGVRRNYEFAGEEKRRYN
jgi:hypothetical protein